MANDPNGEGPVGFSRKGAERVARAVRFAERSYRLPPPPRGRYPVGGGGNGVQFATLNSAILAISGSTPSSAQATLKNFDGTSFSDGDTVTVYNTWSRGVAVGKRVALCWAYNGWFIVTADC